MSSIEKFKKSIIKSSAISTIIIVCSIILSVYNYNKLIKVSYLVAQKESQSNQKYQLLEEKLHSSSAYLEEANKKNQELMQKIEENSKNIHDLQINFVQMQTIQNADKLLAMQFKHILTMASEQLKITQDANMALSTLQTIDSRLENFNNNHWSSLRKALKQDILSLKLQPTIDTNLILNKINTNIDLVNQLEFVSLPRNIASKNIQDTPKNWFSNLIYQVYLELSNLVSIRDINNPKAIQLLPNEEWFIKENLKLLLTQLKLAVYNKNQTDAEMYIKYISQYMITYIDKDNKASINFNKTIKDLAQIKLGNNLNINHTLEAIIEVAE